jgi:hypothetical protein
MADDVTLPGTGAVVETLQQPDGSHRQVIALGTAESAALIAVLKQLASPAWLDPTLGALRVFIQANANNGAVQLAANQALGTVATVTAVNSLNQIGAVPANSLVYDAMQTAWATSVRGRIT